MNKQIFLDIANRLEDKVATLRWIDWDSGQIDLQTQRPAVAFPACLIDMAYPEIMNTGRYKQTVTANITLRLVFMPQGDTHHKSTVRDDALEVFDVIETIHDALQGWGNTALSDLERISAQAERRRDGLKVYRVVYQTSFTETAEPLT